MKFNNAILIPLARSGSCSQESKVDEADEVVQGSVESGKKILKHGATSREDLYQQSQSIKTTKKNQKSKQDISQTNTGHKHQSLTFDQKPVS